MIEYLITGNALMHLLRNQPGWQKYTQPDHRGTFAE